MRAWGTGAGAKAPASPPRRQAEEEDDEVGGRRRSRSRAARGWSRGRELPGGAGRRERQAYGSFGAKGDKGRGKGDDYYGGKGAWGKGGYDWMEEERRGRKGARKGSSKGKGMRSAVEQDSKLEERARRFAGMRSERVASGLAPEEDKKKTERAQRFGMKVPAAAQPESKAAKTDAPKEIAAPVAPADPEAVEKEEQKKKDRAARFGLPVAISKATPVEPAAAAAPASAPAEEAEVVQKMSERAKRFGLATPQGATEKKPAAEKATSTPDAAEAGKEEAKDAAAEAEAKTAAS